MHVEVAQMSMPLTLATYWIQNCLYCLLVCNASAKTTICELNAHFIQKHGTLHSTTFDQGTHFIKNEVRQWAMLMEFTGLARLSIIPEQLM